MKTGSMIPTVAIWGCRGSIPVSGPGFTRHGGATTSFVFEGVKGRILLDAGSGLQAFGAYPQAQARDATLLLSHFHHDHIAGFPFYRHLFRPGWTLEVAAVPREGLGPLEAMAQVHRKPFFPVPLSETAKARFEERVLAPSGTMEVGEFRVEWMEIPHPGGSSAFRIFGETTSVVIATDIELRELKDERFLRFAEGATWAFLDAQFCDDEYPQFAGWGHSTAEDCARFAKAAQIGQLWLTHHDPTRDDDGVDRLVELARAIYPRVAAAYQGLVLELR